MKAERRSFRTHAAGNRLGLLCTRKTTRWVRYHVLERPARFLSVVFPSNLFKFAVFPDPTVK